VLRRCAAQMARHYLGGAGTAPAPMLIGLADDAPDWNLLFWKVFPDLSRDVVRLAVAADMLVPLLDGLENLHLDGRCSCALTSMMTEAFPPFSRIIASCTTAFYQHHVATNSALRAAGSFSVLRLPERRQPSDRG
jgi:hypothetical protein